MSFSNMIIYDNVQVGLDCFKQDREIDWIELIGLATIDFEAHWWLYAMNNLTMNQVPYCWFVSFWLVILQSTSLAKS